MFRALDGGWRITSMPLYIDVHRIYNELAELGIGPDQPLTPDQLFPFDQLHYHGVDAVRDAAGIVGLGRKSRVLEVGSGLGGPARYLAHTVGCQVTAIELQDELHDLARTLTGRCGLDALVTHVRGDALTYPFADGAFDAAVSWLALHHIRRRPRLAARLAQAISPGAVSMSRTSSCARRSPRTMPAMCGTRCMASR
jgi:cyclopropane fatty-acyl-phospholipid synthase-like methyltransferase